jgi:tetratricopeptide (TPR) repeat protein
MKLLIVFLISLAWADKFTEADKLFGAKNYGEALQAYLDAMIDDPTNLKLNYNTGNSLYRLERYEEAIPELQKAAQSPDSITARNSWYNSGNAFFKLGQLEAQDRKKKIGLWREAIAAWKQSLDLDESHSPSKRNIEFAQIKLKEEIDKAKEEQKEQDQQDQNKEQKELSEEAKKAMARALQLTFQKKYAEAQKVLEEIMSLDETASQFSSHVQRLSDVIDIQLGKVPERAIDNANMQKEREMI